MNKRNVALESLRGGACLLVVFCHFAIKNDFGTYVTALARFAVPFFLILSGYFSLKASASENIAFAKRKLFATIRLLIIGTLICTVANTFNCILKGENPFNWIIRVIGFDTLLKLIIFNRAYWLSSVMYYLFMMIYVYIAYIFINKINLLKISYYFIPILLLINITISKISDNWYYAGNFFFTGFPFFMLGNWINYKNIRIKSTWNNLLFVMAGVVLTCVENFFYSKCYCFWGTIVLAVSIFLLGLHGADLKIPNVIVNFGSKYSMLIFLLHCSIGYVLKTVLKIHGIYIGSFEPFVVILVTVICCTPIVLFKERLFVQKR